MGDKSSFQVCSLILRSAVERFLPRRVLGRVLGERLKRGFPMASKVALILRRPLGRHDGRRVWRTNDQTTEARVTRLL